MSASENSIPLSKTKLALLVIGSLLFVAAGIWLTQLDDAVIASQRRYNNPAVMHGLGVAAALLGAAGAVFGARKLFDTRPGLVFGPDGFTDNASATAAGFVPWSEVTGVGVMEFNRQKMLVVGVRDPEKYLARGGALKRMLGRANARMCGSPIVISAHALKTDFGALLTEFHNRLDRYAADAQRGV